MRLTAASLVRLYPGTWRARYGDEMRALLEGSRARRRDRLDLIRGALDAWLHPTTRSRVPAGAALIGGGLWTVAAAASVFQPVALDWPGYLIDVVAIAFVAVGAFLVATVGCSLRIDDGGRVMGAAVWLSVVGYLAWMSALAATAVGMADSPTLAAAQTVAVLGTTLVGVALIRARDDRIGPLLMLGSVAMLVPWTVVWLGFGAAWTAVGMLLVTERAGLSIDGG
jgi:hypothetical protein